MKLNHVLVALGFRPKPKIFGYTIDSFELDTRVLAAVKRGKQALESLH